MRVLLLCVPIRSENFLSGPQLWRFLTYLPLQFAHLFASVAHRLSWKVLARIHIHEEKGNFVFLALG